MASLRNALLRVIVGRDFRDQSERIQTWGIISATIFVAVPPLAAAILSTLTSQILAWWEWVLVGLVTLTYAAIFSRRTVNRLRRQDARAERRLRGLQERLDISEDSELKEIVAEYADDDVAILFDNASRRQVIGGWIAIGLGIAALIAAAAVVWALIINNESTQTTADALARLAITIPAVYAAGVLFKRGGVMQDHGTRLKAAGVAIRAIPLIAGRITDDDTRSAFLRDAYLAQLGGTPAKESKQSQLGDDLVSQLVERLLK